jgi:hypothetical protein
MTWEKKTPIARKVDIDKSRRWIDKADVMLP